jgi:hypothetical protein
MGADELALRAPSYVASLLLFFWVVLFFRSKGFGFTWQLAGLLLVASSTFYMNFIGEARPYLPLAAAACGTATYFTLGLQGRSNAWVRASGWLAIVLAALLHSFALPYALAVAFTFALYLRFTSFDRLRGAKPSIFALLNVPMLVTGSLIWTFFYFFGWGRNVNDLGFDDRIYLYVNQESLWQTFIQYVFDSLPEPLFITSAFLALIIATAYALQSASNRIEFRWKLAGPLILLITSLVLGAATIFANIISNHWIMQRQWIATYVLVALALVWLLAISFHSISKSEGRPARLTTYLPSVLVVLMLVSFVPVVERQLNTLYEYEAKKNRWGLLLIDWGVTTNAEAFQRAAHLEEAANFNLYLGGPVWPEFKPIYENHLKLKERVCPAGCEDRWRVILAIRGHEPDGYSVVPPGVKG